MGKKSPTAKKLEKVDAMWHLLRDVSLIWHLVDRYNQTYPLLPHMYLATNSGLCLSSIF
jgi:hypothetical protein